MSVYQNFKFLVNIDSFLIRLALKFNLKEPITNLTHSARIHIVFYLTRLYF